MTDKELTLKDVEQILNRQKLYFNTQKTKDISFRIQQLKKLKNGVKKYEKDILKALYKDLKKHENESYMSEVGFIYNSINHMIKNLKKWARPKKKLTPIYLMPAKSFIENEPYGSVLIIGPYNYPFQLIIEPLAGAISAGNTVVLKPSEMTPNVSFIIKKIINELFEEDYIACVEGGINTNTALINSRFDYIFFTGSASVGKIIMKAAAQNLIPVTLELGGKSPVIVDETADIKEAAKRIIWGKTMNAGQTCVAPDYVVVHESVKDELIDNMKSAIEQFFGKDIEESRSFGRIINDKHFNRIKTILEEDKDKIIFGGKCNKEDRYIEPTLIETHSFKCASMKEEIFGPILPIISYNNLDDIIEKIKTLPMPLALYIFTTNKKSEMKIMNMIRSGNVCINDTISHLANPYIPFGGVGDSGMGAYHGEDSFRTFSHRKGILKKPAKLGIPLLYPPFTEKQLKIIKKFLK
ncbi:aldehyde dehydrogenase [uncultured Clostridium sp.]|uniref:aldehyde dehydrogenase n=1 Tax=uncultured Clostridium sp. TaxID=59620 RepID=UPI0025E73FB1|nr:aldehyde dehydrogenase [uncultured Clostridium sp.]